jgi:hypothetical protein
MDMIDHDDKAIDFYSSVFCQKLQAVQDKLFVFVFLQQVLPLQDGGGEEVYIVLGLHAEKIGRKEERYKAAEGSVVGGLNAEPAPQHQQRQSNGENVL